MKTIKVNNFSEVPKIFTGIAESQETGNKIWYKNGLFHREDGAALELSYSYKEFWLNGCEFKENWYWFFTLTYCQRGLEIPKDLIKRFKICDFKIIV